MRHFIVLTGALLLTAIPAHLFAAALVMLDTPNDDWFFRALADKSSDDELAKQITRVEEQILKQIKEQPSDPRWRKVTEPNFAAYCLPSERKSGVSICSLGSYINLPRPVYALGELGLVQIYDMTLEHSTCVLYLKIDKGFVPLNGKNLAFGARRNWEREKLKELTEFLKPANEKPKHATKAAPAP